MPAPRILFMGTPEFALDSLRACLEVGEVVAVVTQPDKPRDRGQASSAPPVKRLALEHGLKVLQPTKLRDAPFLDSLRTRSPEVALVAAYGKILPRELLDLPASGSVNVHASLLPRFRGAAPIQWAIASGDQTTGVCLMKMELGLDTGPVLASAHVAIRPDETYESLWPVLARLGAQLIRTHLLAYLRGELHPTPQPSEGVVLAPMLKKEDGLLDFRKSAAELERRARAFQPWPGTFVFLGGKILKVRQARLGDGSGPPGTVLSSTAKGIEVACGSGSLWLAELQPEGKRAMTAADFLAGHQISVGDRPFGA
ncbi:MAG TPA: methionyl-tRNA formyltransferase [Myxococcaceae bacterium]|nr:methionyl-tRNA formyltransferase [Myxococcaceae bacterium]